MSGTVDPALEAERAVLGALLLAPERISQVSAELSAEDFSPVALQVLFRHLLRMHDRGEPIDFLTLVASLRDAGSLQTVGGADAIAALSQCVTTVTHVNHHAWIVRDAAQRRRLKAKARRLADSDDAAAIEETGRELMAEVELSLRPEGTQARPWTPFPVDALPDVLREFVTLEARALDVDPAALALGALVATSAAIGNERVADVHGDGSYLAPAALWGCPIAPSGSGKTPAIDVPCAPLEEAEDECEQRFREAMDAHKREVRAWDMRNKKGGERERPSPAEADVLVDTCVRPEPPVRARVVVSDVTVEGLAVALESNPRGVLLKRDELAGLLRSNNSYRSNGAGGDEEAWLSIWNAKRLCYVRVDAARCRSVPRAFVSIIGTIQPGVAREVFGGVDRLGNGMTARYLFVMPPARAQRFRPPAPSHARTRYAELLRSLMARPMPEHGPRRVRLDADARRVYAEHYDATADALDGRYYATGDDAGAALAAKSRDTALRLALVLGAATDPNAPTIDGETMRQAVELARWFAGEAERVLAVLRGGARPSVDPLASLGAWVASHGPVTARDVAKSGPRAWRGSSERVETALDKLAAAGRIQRLPGARSAQYAGPRVGDTSTRLEPTVEALPALQATPRPEVSPSPLSPGDGRAQPQASKGSDVSRVDPLASAIALPEGGGTGDGDTSTTCDHANARGVSAGLRVEPEVSPALATPGRCSCGGEREAYGRAWRCTSCSVLAPMAASAERCPDADCGGELVQAGPVQRCMSCHRTPARAIEARREAIP